MNMNGPKGAQSPRTAIAGAAIVAYRAIKRGADANHVVQGTAASVNLGIAIDHQDYAERIVPYAAEPGELVTGEAGAAVAVDALLKSDANGRLVTAVAADPVIAVAREAAAALGDLICIEILPPNSKA